jgi:molybdopterin/thiamine biosynthesis adenylyltransferase
MSSEIADRHLIAVEGLGAAAEAAPAFVRVRVDARWSDAIGGQLLISCLVNLLCRQVGLVRHIEIVAPTTSLRIVLPSGPTGTDFPRCLEELAAWAVQDAITVSSRETSDHADHEIVIGAVAQTASKQQTLVVLGDGWRAWVGLPSHAPAGVVPGSINPLGPFLAAALAAGEVFKRTCGIARGRFLERNGYSLWSGQAGPDWAALTEGPDLAGKVLDPFHMVGAGAVGNDLAYILANAKLAAAYVVALDDDTYDTKNLNRCLAAGWHDLDDPKVDAVARLLKAGGIDVLPFSGTIKSYMSDPRHGLRLDVAQSVGNLDFGIVASCVDKGISRQDVQSLRPRVLVGGSTLDLQARANVYNLRPGAACLACYNPAERDGQAIRKLERDLKAMSREDRAQTLRGYGLDPDAVEAYFAGTECGGVGETTLKTFATRPPALFSVGFVSLGAALLLAAVTLRTTIFAGTAPARADMTTLNFLNGGLMDAGLGADEKCEWGCQQKLHSL